MPESEQPKIIIDTDWKSQAQAEKERLSQATKPQTPAPAAPPGHEGEAEPPPGVPEKVGFRELVSLLISQAIAYLGGYPDPRTGQAMVALDLARMHIDMLAVLEEKTKGNLTDAESKLLTRALQELRMEFVEVARAVERAVAEGRARSVGPEPGAAAVTPKLNIPPGLRTGQ